MKNTLRQRLVYLNRSRANLILKNLYCEFEELNEFRSVLDLGSGLSKFQKALASFSLALESKHPLTF